MQAASWIRSLLMVPLLVLGAATLVLNPATRATPAPASPILDLAVIAHRGSSGIAPENTLASVEVAIDQGANWFEVDIQRSRDGALILLHDRSLARTTNVKQVFPNRSPWNVGDFTLEEIRLLDAGSWFHSSYAGEPVPTLEELLDLIGDRIGLFLEVKDPSLYPGIEADIAEALSSAALPEERLAVQSFDHNSMAVFHVLAPQVPVGLLFNSRPNEVQLVAASLWADHINSSRGVTDQALVDRIHELGMKANVWTVNTGQEMLRLIDLEVDGITTDYPVVMLDLLSRR